MFQQEELNPSWWEQKLWHLYNATDYSVNLFNCPTVAYSGEKDRQIQAAQAMERSVAEEGISLQHIVGSGMGHKYDQTSKHEINARIDEIVKLGRDPLPLELKFTTFTLRYNTQSWISINGMEEHWSRARVHARVVGDSRVEISTENVTHLAIDMKPGR